HLASNSKLIRELYFDYKNSTIALCASCALITLITSLKVIVIKGSMGILTEREKEVMSLLRRGKSVKDIGKELKIPVTSVSRSITSIRRKAQDMEEDILFLRKLGYLDIKDCKIVFITPDRDPKALSKLK
ncbi:LuxR C-terminal-related transcriptional regulator, partial [Methanomassiliicoccus luminyensis]|uniref:LuxR C-terminal-related transcriptional regulator n=1 Tax=Methanomassiliicoccus luminyensis TaxID=1080712 RepID=UPI001EFFF3A7